MRLQERQRRHRESDGDEAAGRETKRLRLEEIENQAMNEENPDKISKLFEDVRGHPDGDGNSKRRRVQPGEGRDVASSSSVPPLAVEADDMDVNEVSIEYGKFFDGWGEFAIDDIPGAQLPFDLVRAARREEMHHMLSRTVKVVKTAEACEKTVKGPISTKWVDVDKSHGVGEMLIRSRWVATNFNCLVAFVHESRDLMGVVHGDDFVFVGLDVDLDYIVWVLRANHELKSRGRLGSGDEDAKVIDMLGRKLRRYDWGLTWQASSRHKTLLMEYFGMKDNFKVLSKNGYKDDPAKGGFEEQVLDKDEMKAFRMLAARLNYIAQDDPTVQFAAKELCRKMSSATKKDFTKLKKLVWFLVGVEEVLWEYPWQNEREATAIKIQVDSDWAGCERTRRSTSRGCIAVGQHPLRTWSSTQSVVPTSSAEAEVYGMSEGDSRCLGLQSMMLELGIEVKLFLMTDSVAAKSFSSTRGLGWMRYVEVKDLWL